MRQELCSCTESIFKVHNVTGAPGVGMRPAWLGGGVLRQWQEMAGFWDFSGKDREEQVLDLTDVLVGMSIECAIYNYYYQRIVLMKKVRTYSTMAHPAGG